MIEVDTNTVIAFKPSLVKYELSNGISVFLEDHATGKGTVIVNTAYGSFSNYWPGMGSRDLKGFVKAMNKEYFAEKLCKYIWVFCPIQSTKNLRRFIRTELNHELPWYRFRNQQKEMRKQINKLRSTRDENQFVEVCQQIPSKVSSALELERWEKLEWNDLMRTIFFENAGYFLDTRHSKEYILLTEVFEELKAKLREGKS